MILTRSVLSGLLLLVIQSGFANFTNTVSPTTIPLNVPTVITFTLTSGVNNLGSAEITIPAGVTGPAVVGDVTLVPSDGKSWTVNSVSSTLVRFSADGAGSANRLNIGQSMTISFSVTITTPGGKVFASEAFTSNNFTGNGVGVVEGGHPVINDVLVCLAPTARLYVNSAIGVSGTGSTWACAIKELRDAVTIAASNPAIKSIWVAKGTYKATAGLARTAAMTITRADLKILGGFMSGDLTEGAANPVANPTIISGDIGVGGDATDNSYHMIVIRDVPLSADPLMIDGFILSGGNANTAGTLGGSGGAILAYNNLTATTISISRCLFTQNSSILYGGAIFSYKTNLTITGSWLVLNSSASGGGMFGWFSSPIISKTVFANNSASISGGGYYGNIGTPLFTLSVFSSNTAVAEGGGVYQNGSGGVYNNCVFAGNSSEWSGGLHQHNGVTSTIRNSTFYGNTATNLHGAGGLMLGSGANTTDTRNTIFWKNKRQGMDNVANADVKNTYNTVNTFKNCMLQSGTTIPIDNGTNLADNLRAIDPMFTNAIDPAGADFMFGTADDGLQLMDASAGKNSGANADVVTAVDLSNNTRVLCGTVDRGAYENTNCVAPPRAVAQESKKNIDAATGVIANPFTSDLQVRYTGTERATLNVYDVSGKPRYNNSNISQGVTHVEAGSWGKGMYQVVLTTETGKRMIFKAMKM